MGALDDRDESNLYGGDKEKQLYMPQDSFYQVSKHGDGDGDGDGLVNGDDLD